MGQISAEFNTTEDMLMFWYGSRITGMLYGKEYDKETPPHMPSKPPMVNQAGQLVFADAPAITTTTGYRNTLYGAMLYAQMLTATNIFSILPKKPWRAGGWKAVTALGSTSGVGVAQNAALPDTTKPTIALVKPTIKMQSKTCDMSTWQAQVPGDDSITWEEHKEWTKIAFMKSFNADLLGDVHTVAGNNPESVDRITMSNSAVAGGLCDANDADPWAGAIDRDAGASWADAQVNHGSTTDRTLALSHIDAVYDACYPYWKSTDNKVFITGTDTYTAWKNLMQSQLRYEQMRVAITVNGIDTHAGVDAGFDVASYRGVPIVVDDNVVQDTISRIHLLDLDNLFLSMWLPVLTAEATGPEGWLTLAAFRNKALYASGMELICTCFKGQGSVRDLK